MTFPRNWEKIAGELPFPTRETRIPTGFMAQFGFPIFCGQRAETCRFEGLCDVYIYSYKYIYISTDYIYDVHICFCIIYPLLICSMEQTHLKWGHPLFVDLPLGLSTGQKSMRRRIW